MPPCRPPPSPESVYAEPEPSGSPREGSKSSKGSPPAASEDDVYATVGQYAKRMPPPNIEQKDNPDWIKPEVRDYDPSNLVVDLSQNTFQNFLKANNIVMVMFYDSWKNNDYSFRKELQKAAETTTRRSTAYATVDCVSDEPLCRAYGIKETPTFTVFSNTFMASNIRNPLSLGALAMRRVVESTPFLKDPKS